MKIQPMILFSSWKTASAIPMRMVTTRKPTV